jgi:hypothetical protein
MSALGLTHFEDTAIQVTLAGKQAKFLAGYLSSSRPLVGAEMTQCFVADYRFLYPASSMPKTRGVEITAETKREKFLRNDVDGNFCLFFLPDNPTTYFKLPPPLMMSYTS